MPYVLFLVLILLLIWFVNMYCFIFILYLYIVVFFVTIWFICVDYFINISIISEVMYTITILQAFSSNTDSCSVRLGRRPRKSQPRKLETKLEEVREYLLFHRYIVFFFILLDLCGLLILYTIIVMGFIYSSVSQSVYNNNPFCFFKLFSRLP